MNSCSDFFSGFLFCEALPGSCLSVEEGGGGGGGGLGASRPVTPGRQQGPCRDRKAEQQRGCGYCETMRICRHGSSPHVCACTDHTTTRRCRRQMNRLSRQRDGRSAGIGSVGPNLNIRRPASSCGLPLDERNRVSGFSRSSARVAHSAG